MPNLGDWNIQTPGQDSPFLLSHSSGLALKASPPVIQLAGGATIEAAAWSKTVRSDATGIHLEQRSTAGLTILVDIQSLDSAGMLAVSCRVVNHGGSPIRIETISPLGSIAISGPASLGRILLNGADMNGHSELVPARDGLESWSVLGYTDASGDCALVAGFEDLRFAGHRFAANSSSFQAFCLREGTALGAGGVLMISRLLIAAGPGLAALMDDYAARSGRVMGARRTPAKTGWCSWYTYYGTENHDDIVRNVESLAASPLGRQIRVIQIDDGWNLPKNGAPRNWGDWYPGSKFPHGMKAVADEIRRRGYEPGLWLAPFSVEEASELRRNRPDLLVKDENGQPKSFWGVYGLDLTNPDALAFLRELFNRVFNEWGFTYIKIDFLIHAIQPGVRHDNNMTTVEAFHQGLSVIREVAGNDRYILNCGSLMGPAVGICDAMRIGLDVSHRWYIPMNLGAWPIGNCNLLAGSVHTIWRQWMHGRWWNNDPDCLVTHDDGTPGEKAIFGKEFDRAFATEPRYGLTDEEASMWIRLVWLTGGLAMVGEDISALKPERLALLGKAFPLNPHPAQVVDHYVHGRAAVLLSVGDRRRIGVFNLTEEPKTLRVPARKLGISGTARFRERYSAEEFTAPAGDVVEFPVLPPHGGRIWELLA